MSKLPYLPLFTNDWLASAKIITMTPAEEGAYIRLLCIAWNDDQCSLPDDDASLAAMSRLNSHWPESSAKIRACFEAHDGRLYNEKLLHHWQKSHDQHEKKAAGGVKGMLSRWSKRVNKPAITELKDSNNSPITSIPIPIPTPISTPSCAISLNPSGSAPSGASAPAPERKKEKVIDFDGEGWTGISDKDREAWTKAYPACDIDRQVAAAAEWAKANPRKAKKNWRRFIVNWLSRKQERGGDVASTRPLTPDGKIAYPDYETRQQAMERRARAKIAAEQLEREKANAMG